MNAPRLLPGQAVEVRRRKQDRGKPIDQWEKGAKFSHYSGGKTTVEWAERRMETLPNEDVRPERADV